LWGPLHSSQLVLGDLDALALAAVHHAGGVLVHDDGDDALVGAERLGSDDALTVAVLLVGKNAVAATEDDDVVLVLEHLHWHVVNVDVGAAVAVELLAHGISLGRGDGSLETMNIPRFSTENKEGEP